ncbi:MAG: VOC family protein [Spirochaetales bacterium]|nr:VOC family protein [Spirochaetales bacterium]
MKVRSLCHAGVTVRNLEEAARWYWEVFRLPLVAAGEMNRGDLERMKALYRLEDCSLKFGMLLCPKGGTIEIFEFSKTEVAEHRWNSPGVTHFTFDVKGIFRWHEKLTARGDVEVLTPVQNTDGNQWFFFRDPDGNLVELMDLKFNYILLRYLSRIAGFFMRKFQFSSIYKVPVVND